MVPGDGANKYVTPSFISGVGYYSGGMVNQQSRSTSTEDMQNFSTFISTLSNAFNQTYANIAYGDPRLQPQPMTPEPVQQPMFDGTGLIILGVAAIGVVAVVLLLKD